jgi:hypothetical protein
VGTASDQVKTNDNQEDGQKKEAIRERAPNKYRTSTEQATEISPSVVALLKAIGNQELKITEMMEGVGLKHRPTFLYYYLTPAIEA